MSEGPESGRFERADAAPSDSGGAAQERRLQRAARVVFLLALAGGLGLWAHLRMPRELRLDVDLTAALPGQLAEVDVVVAREGAAVARQRSVWGPEGAPAVLHLELRARPGEHEVETTLVDRAHHAQRVRRRVVLREGETGTVRPVWQEL